MEEIIRDLLCWQPPNTLKTIWADHLYSILIKHNNLTTSGWLRRLLHPSTEKKGSLENVEREMVQNLYKIINLKPRGFSVALLAKMWGVSKRCI